jgi:intracellular septation protein A
VAARTQRILGAIRWVVADFGPLIMFWLLDLAFGLKPAIAGSVVFILGDSLWRWWQGRPFTRLYLLSATLTVLFGGVDLLAVTPFMLKYEAVITNVFTGFAFVAGARGPRPMLQEMAEQRQGGPFPDRLDITRFFQLFTLLWAAYFFVKAGFYLTVAALMPLPQAMIVRSVVGSASLALMIAVSVTQGRRLFRLCRWLGLLPAVTEPADSTAR